MPHRLVLTVIHLHLALASSNSRGGRVPVPAALELPTNPTVITENWTKLQNWTVSKVGTAEMLLVWD